MPSYGSRNYTVEWEVEGRTLTDTYVTTGPPLVHGQVITTQAGHRVAIDDVAAPEDSEGRLLGSIYGHPFRG